MSLWAIENFDDAGEGLFVCDAESPEDAIRIYREHENNPAQIVSVEQVQWIDMATVTGEFNQTNFYEKKRRSEPANRQP